MKLIEITGIGEIRNHLFEENGIFSTDDLINYYPYKYYDFTKTEPFSDDGKVRLIRAIAIENAKIIRARKNLTFVSVKMQDEVGHIFTAMWFNQTYIKSQIYLGIEMYLYGKNSPTKKNTFIVTLSKQKKNLNFKNYNSVNSDFIGNDKETTSCSKRETSGNEGEKNGEENSSIQPNLGFLPVYHSVGKIGQKVIHDTINKILQSVEFSTFVPHSLLQKFNLIDLKKAYIEIHNPSEKTNLDECFDRVQIENLLPILATNEYNKTIFRCKKGHKYDKSIEIKSEFEQLLPFKLTPDQNKVIYEIENDMTSKFSMNRLLQGDVGSGKTVVAFFGAFLAAKNGFQSAIIAPTEILANQHYNSLKKLLKGTNIKISLVTGSLSGFEKQATLNDIKNGISSIVIGTHAVLSENVEFNNLTYIVVDEQHRFGVEQRAKLKEKGINPDILVMSATPIPRTLSLVVYGDLDISFIENRPNKQNIKTNIVKKEKQEDMWKYIDEKIKNGSKVYVVCSKIDEENDDDGILKFSAKNMYEFLCTKFDKRDVALIHGKLAKSTQNKVLDSFKYGITRVLVSTTIVEVGVDVPDSDIMVIATPERFGLATLHQLRGRIGRNGEESFCFCLADNLTEKSYERILYFKSHDNGLDIADFDLKTRGAGSVIGTNQHGNDNSLIAKFSEKSYSLAKQILEFIKQSPQDYVKLLEKGANQESSKILNKIILN